jgi:tetraacyldisaccharide 4'-kinase
VELSRYWQSVGAVPLLLLPVAGVFTVLATARRLLFRFGWRRSTHLPVPVIVVGNITAGGTGKTPLVLWLARNLQEQGMHPGLVTRGYGGRNRAPHAVSPGSVSNASGDEAVLLAERSRCPVWAGADRPECARRLLEAHPETDVIVSDDGLQHYPLARDIEIAVVDGDRGFGNGLPLPAGPMREPVGRLDASIAVVVNGDLKRADIRRARDRLVQGRPPVPVLTMHYIGSTFRNLRSGTQCDAAAFRGRRVHAIAGTGYPKRFFEYIARLGIDASETAFPDHHPYRRDELARIDADFILMTEKDAVKCRAFDDERLWMLPIEAHVDARLSALVADRIAQRRRPL